MVIEKFRGRSRGKANAHLAALVDSSADAIISKSLDGKILSWNGAATRIFGYEREEMIGQSVRRLIPIELQGEEDEIIERVSGGEIVGKFETVRRHKDGHLIPIALTISPIRAPDGTIVGASKIAHDLSGEQAARMTLKGSESRFRMLADNIDQLAWIADASGHIGWYNRRWYEYTGTDLQEMEGWGWKKVHHPDHLDRVTRIWTEALARGEDWEDTFPLRRHDGEYGWFLSRAHAIRDADGNILYWFGTNTDVTERQEYENRIQVVLGECNHRAKNMLTMVQALVHRIAPEGHPFVEQLERRLGALAANQDLLISSAWTSVPLKSLIESQLAYVADLYKAGRIRLSGPDIDCRPNAAEALGLAIHELATNAAKYGALSSASGYVVVEWSVEEREGRSDRFVISWTEHGGPAVAIPEHTGFGSIVIRRNPELTLGAQVTLDYAEDGLRWRVEGDAERVIV